MKADMPTEDEIETHYSEKVLGPYMPKSVINLLWFYSTILFGMHGREGEHRSLKWGDVVLYNDPLVGEYLELNLDLQTKARTGDDPLNTKKTKPTQHANVDKNRCPIAIYKLYAEKRPHSMLYDDALYYLAPVTHKTHPSMEERWFLSQLIGVNKLKAIMRKMIEVIEGI